MSKLSRLGLRRRADPPVASADPDPDTDTDTDGATATDARLPRSLAQRVYLALFAVVAGLLIVSVLWIVVTGLIARAQLQDVKGQLKQLRSAISAGDIPRAQRISRHIAEQTASAHQLTSGPAWWVGSNIPALGTPLRTGRVIAVQADRIGHHALPGVIDLADDVVRSPRHNGSIDLRPVQRAAGSLDAAARVLASASRAVDATEASWLPLVSGPRRETSTELHTLRGQVATADRAVDTLLPMLGADRPQRYFLGFMNEAEERALGGLPGAFAIFTVDRGRVHFTHFGSDDDLLRVRADIPVSAQYRALYGQNDPTGDIRNSNLSPNFPDAARIWAGLWKAKSGETVDGAVAIDPSAIGYLLAKTGPATLPDGSKVTADNVVALTQERQYALYGSSTNADKAARKRYLVNIASAVSLQALDSPSLRPLASAAELAIRQRRLLVWSANTQREKVITDLGLGGVLDAKGRPFAAFFLNNAAGGKMDFYQESSLTYRRSSCAAGATATTTLRLTNNAPNYALPPYVTTVAGAVPKGSKPGFNRSIVAFYATPGARITSVTLDGQPQLLATAPEGAFPTVRLLVDLPVHATRTLTVTTSEPKATGPVLIVRQPAVRALRVSIAAPSCG